MKKITGTAVTILILFSGCAQKTPPMIMNEVYIDKEFKYQMSKDRDSHWNDSLYADYRAFSQSVDNIFGELDSKLESIRQKDKPLNFSSPEVGVVQTDLYFSNILKRNDE